MRGKAKTINTAADKENANLSDDQIIEMATISVRRDKAVYPDGYDKTLKEGEDGFIEPDYEFYEEIDQTILNKFKVKI